MDTTVAPASEAELIASLPSDFRWGVATSAYQIEGAYQEDGRGVSIWDTYCRTPGMVEGGENGDVACDHYHRMPQDVALIKSLGVDVYRFSVAWPRIQADGTGPANEKGLAFYDRLVDELLHAGVDPWVTLYHWDLPQALEDKGGWPERDTAYRFADYAMLVFDRLRDRVRTWTTLNEPWCSAMLGYYEGRQAPGRQNFADAMDAVHHLLLGHGLAAQRMRAAATQPIELGITLNMGTAMAATESLADQEAARRADGLGARIYLDPLLRGQYPGDIMDDLSVRGIKMPVVDGDLAIISEPIDVLGVNYYSSHRFSGVDAAGRTEDEDGNPISVNVPLGRPVTAMDWEIVPEGFTELLVRLSQEYPGTAMVITENGAAFDDEADQSGYVADHDRTSYLSSHIAAVAAARQQGADVRGYFAWSLMDNFEWSYGYAKRFGLVHVDYETQVRTPKQSALWYRDTVRRARGH
ncbi:beta-glucosidase [Actinophytocola algeriensis]|uniref:Beta-glucosidase n=1 Tax=Actinophytocola algeriensis TaxID=1768010 RepID=A0A7W7Q6D4_9PSEU|nr:beta-glucosidase [Actinophytocola algeriensis]MBE1479688.1 beta-glucosidase [Actinophytocola algeriensis]